MKTSTKSKTKKSSSKTKKDRMSNSQQPKTDIYQQITNKIISDLEKGNLTWRKPWNSEHLQGQVMRPLRWNNIPYTGINTLLLWGAAAEKGFTSPHWMTFNQAKKLNGSVRKGEGKNYTITVFMDKLTVEEENDKGEIENRHIPYLKSYLVYNASQIEGLPEKYYEIIKPEVNPNSQERIEEIENFFAQTKADIYTGTKASYNQSTDRIQMPPFECFESPESYYAVLAHELTHWTKHPTRLDRDFGRKNYGDVGYAKEELVAELGACFLCADLGLNPMAEENHSAYIQSWLEILKNDKKFIFFAASHSQKAATFIHKINQAHHKLLQE